MAQIRQSKNSTTKQKLPGDAAYVALADKRRRLALHYIKQQSRTVPLGELSEQVAAWENQKDIERLTSQERKRVYISLYQSHLPTLDDQGLVEYDVNAGEVSISESFDRFDLYLEVVPKKSVSWSRYYLGLTGANATILALAWGDITPFGSVPGIGWAAMTLVTFGLSAIIQSYTDRRMRLGDDGPPPEVIHR